MCEAWRSGVYGVGGVWHLVLLDRAQVLGQLALQALVELEEGRLLLLRLLVELGQVGAVVLHLVVLLEAVRLGWQAEGEGERGESRPGLG